MYGGIHIVDFNTSFNLNLHADIKVKAISSADRSSPICI